MSDGEQGTKMVMAIIRPDKLSDVKTALAEVGALSLAVINISGRGSQSAKEGRWHGEEYIVDLHQKVKVEYVVADIPANGVIDAVADTAQTGEKGDDRTFALPVEGAVQVRTDKEGGMAI